MPLRKYGSLAMLLLLLVAAPADAQQSDRYLLLATSRTETMQNEINAAAERGFRVVGASRTEGTEEVVVLERTPESYRYRLLATTRTGTLQKELNEAAEAGYRVVPRAAGTKRQLSDVMKRSNPKQSGTNTEGELFVLLEKGPQPASVSYVVLATRHTGTLQKELNEAAERGYSLVALVSRTEHIAILELAK